MTADVKVVTNLLTYANVGSEMIYILNNRIKSLEIETEKRISILSQIATFLFVNDENERYLKDLRSVASLDTLASMLHQVCHKSVITLDMSSFEKMIEMVLMALKKDLTIMKNDFGIVSVVNNHFDCVETITGNKGVTTKYRQLLSKLLDSVTPYGFFMMKRDILNLLLFKQSKISIYLRDVIQANDGHFIVRPPKIAGFNCERTGTIRTWPGGKVEKETVEGLKVSIATKFKTFASYKQEENDKLGCDMFENLKKNELVIVDKEYLTKISDDLSNKIIGASSLSPKKTGDTLNLDFNFDSEDVPKPTFSGKSEVNISAFGSNISSFDASKTKGGKAAGKVKGFLDDDDDDNFPVADKNSKSANSKLTGGNLLDMMDDL